MKLRSDELKPRNCNLCQAKFHPQTVFDRFCWTCREKSELLKFSEWLPEFNEAVADELSA